MRPKRKPNSNLEALYKQRGSCCHYCEIKLKYEYITKDHVKPKSKGHSLKDNWVFSCRPCNSKKSSLTPEEFLNLMINNIINVLRKLKNNNFIATESQVSKIKYFHKVMMNTKKLI